MIPLKHIISVYKDFSKYLVLTNAKFMKYESTNLINSTWTMNDVTSLKSKSINIIFTVDTNFEKISRLPSTLIDEEIIYDIHSQCGIHRVICLERKCNDSLAKDNKENIIHLWRGEDFVKSINIKELDVHGPVYKKDFNFGNMQFLASGDKIVYLAESKKPKRTSYFQTQSPTTKAENIGNQYLFKENFGEQLDYIECPTVCILDLIEEKVDVVDAISADFIAGRITAHPCHNSFIITAYKRYPYNLGLIYCTQRQSELYHYDIESKSLSAIGDTRKSKMSARFSPDGKFLIWLENEASGAHMQCQRLMCHDLSQGCTTTVVDIVRDSIKGFRGIYNLGLTDNCWSDDCRHVFLTSLDGCENKICGFNVESGLISKLEVEDRCSTTLLDIKKDVLLIKVSSPNLIPYLAVADVNLALKSGKISLRLISSIHRIDDISWDVVHTKKVEHSKDGWKDIQSIFITPTNKDETPLILALHGGPHSSFNNDFQLFFAAAAQLGFSSLLVNYRGSLGYGQDFIESLMGHIGDMDANDCIEACDDILQRFPKKLSSNNIFLYGGSHGGFLAAILASKYSDKVRAAACRNPVINIPSMLSSTDIPDWTFTEAGLSWDHKYLLSDDQLISMWNMSPLRYVNGIKCPVLVMLGQEDKRVPPSQGKELVRALNARGIPCELYIYPKDSHPLASIEASSDCFVNIICWFNKEILKE